MNKASAQAVLIAVCDEELSHSIESALDGAGFDVLLSPSTDSAIKLLTSASPAFIVLDSSLPEMGGMRLCKFIRTELHMRELRIIIISAVDDPSERVLALNVGADDYLVSPVDMEQLLSKITGLQHRRRVDQLQHVLKAGTIQMVPEQWVVYVDGSPVDLTETEYRLLQELLEVEGRVLTREDLLERVWGYKRACTVESRTLDVHMSRLRHKLGASAENIVTVRNVGYRIKVSPDWLRH
ncbi:response regulator transcription factor [Litorivivens sp.]|uniref:response regulator transcription factor n=1 Tax=Litorivivens sp. TaxID=2020868 RepID=UPI003569AB66